MSHKTEMLQMIERMDLANGERFHFVKTNKTGTFDLLDRYGQARQQTRQQLQQKSRDLTESMAEQQQLRLRTQDQFKAILYKESRVRKEANQLFNGDTQALLTDFKQERRKMNENLQRASESLRDSLERSKQERLEQAASSRIELKQKSLELQNEKLQRSKNLAFLLNDMHAQQQKIRAELAQEFQAAQAERGSWAADREEIREAWSAMRSRQRSTGQTARPASKADRCKNNEAKIPVAESKPLKDSSKPHQQAECSAEKIRTGDHLLKVRAAIAAFPEGCRFSELYRGIEGMSKSELRECLAHMLKTHDLRRDLDDRYHLT